MTMSSSAYTKLVTMNRDVLERAMSRNGQSGCAQSAGQACPSGAKKLKCVSGSGVVVSFVQTKNKWLEMQLWWVSGDEIYSALS
jgi:hypothetical protein